MLDIVKSNTIEIMIVDDHPLFRSALKEALELSIENVNCREASSLLELEGLLSKNKRPELVLLDLQMPDANGFSGLAHLRAHHPELCIILISAHDSQDVMQMAKQHGANGFISKSSDIISICNATTKVINGEDYYPDLVDSHEGGTLHSQADLLEKISALTAKQYEVFHHCSQGLLNKQIAYEMGVTEATVKAHITAIMRKLEINNRTQIVIISNTVKEKLNVNFN